MLSPRGQRPRWNKKWRETYRWKEGEPLRWIRTKNGWAPDLTFLFHCCNLFAPFWYCICDRVEGYMHVDVRTFRCRHYWEDNS